MASGDFWQSATVANASNSIERDRIAALPTADDYNKKEEEKIAAQKAADDTANMVPAMTRDKKKYLCANPGCTKRSFTLEENGPG